MSDWWATSFGADYLARYAHRSDAAAVAEVAGILPLLPPGPVLDACCGAGRHLQALLAAGREAYGFDYSADLLQAAAARPGLAGRLWQADMRAPGCRAGWPAICLFFTAFGYFDDAQNAVTLQGFAHLLAPGGRLLLDLPDAARLRASLVPHSQSQLADGSSLEDMRSWNGKRVEKRSLLRRDGAVVEERFESVRVYDDQELPALAADCGLRVVARWSSLRGPEEDDGRALWCLERVCAP